MYFFAILVLFFEILGYYLTIINNIYLKFQNNNKNVNSNYKCNVLSSHYQPGLIPIKFKNKITKSK